MPWVGTIVHSGPFRQASPGIKSALPTIGKSIVRYLHAHTDTYVRSVEAPIHSQAGLVKQPVLKNNFSKVPNLPSPVISNVLNTELIEYDSVLRKHLVSGFQYGFRLGTLGEAPSLIWKNHKSATGNPVKVFEKLAKASLKKRIAGPFKNPPLENFTCSSLGLVPTSEYGKFRLIHDLSFPKSNSVNSNIPPENSVVQYDGIDTVIKLVKKFGRNCKLAKCDIEDAFRIVCVHPSDYHLLGFTWNHYFYYDRCLPMGTSSSRQIFENFPVPFNG
jgi:hypothetical protein